MKSAPGSVDISDILLVCSADGQLDLRLLKELLGYFIDENTRRMKLSADAVEAGDRRTLREVAHAVRGSAAMLRAGRLHDLAWALADDAASDHLESLARSVAAMSGEFDQVLAALREAHPQVWGD